MKKIQFPVLFIILLSLIGCIDRKTDSGVITYTTALWLTLAFLFGGIGLIYASRFAPKTTDPWYSLSNRIPLVMKGVGACLLFLVLVTINEKVTVSTSGFSERIGLIGMTMIHEVVFRDLEKIEIIKETNTDGRKTTTHYFLVCYEKNGSTRRIPASGQLIQAAFGDIANALHAAGIPVINKTSEP